MPAPSAVLFDVDGTLIDSNYLHVDAWSRAFETLHLTVPSWRIHAAIGQDSPTLIRSLLSAEDAEEHETQASDLHTAYYAERMPRLVTLPGARELVHEVARRGFRVVLATSASPDELTVLLSVLDCDDALHAVTSSGDVDKSKPAPALIDVALEKAGVDAQNAVMVGDAVWDMIAATRAGVAGAGMLCGGIGEADLRDAGAAAVYAEPANLLERIDSSPIARLPRP